MKCMYIEHAQKGWLKLQCSSTSEFLTKGISHVPTSSSSPPLHFISPPSIPTPTLFRRNYYKCEEHVHFNFVVEISNFKCTYTEHIIYIYWFLIDIQNQNMMHAFLSCHNVNQDLTGMDVNLYMLCNNFCCCYGNGVWARNFLHLSYLTVKKT